MNLDMFLLHYGLLAIFLLLFTKSIGVPIPIPADVLLLTTAAGAAQGKFILWQAIVAVLCAVVCGGLIQFLIARRAGRTLLLRFGRFLGLTPQRLDATSTRVKKGGIVGVSIAILIPGIRGVAITAAGLAGLPLSTFAPGLVLGSILFLSVHFFLGYLGGSLLSTLEKILPVPGVLAIVTIVLLLAFALWAIALYRRKSARREQHAATLEMWHEGICPVCLALSTVSSLSSPTTPFSS